jgi:benzoyl-CoA-dihydrodiol lyase
VPLLGVLPGTGGLTRVTDKRHVRHDLADIFCTTTEGVRGQKRAKDWRLVDEIAKPARLRARCRNAPAARRAERPPGRRQGRGAHAADADVEADGCATERDGRHRPRQAHRHLHRQGARPAAAADIAGIEAAGELVPARDGARTRRRHPHMRTNELDIGTWLHQDRRRCCGRARDGRDDAQHQNHWLVRETTGLLRRTFSRLDVSSRSLFALIEPGSCFRRHASSNWRSPATASIT